MQKATWGQSPNRETLNTESLAKGGESYPQMFESPFVKIREIERHSTIYEVYFNEDIGAPHWYTDLVCLLGNATEKDEIHIFINSYGGRADSTVMIINAMANSNAVIATIANGVVASAGTFIFLSSDVQIVNPHCQVMLHNRSGGLFGKGHEIKAQADFEHDYWIKLCHEVYEGFLSDEEIERLIAGEDFWFNSEQTAERLTKRVEYFMKQEEDQMQEAKELLEAEEAEAAAKAKPKPRKRAKPRTKATPKKK